MAVALLATTACGGPHIVNPVAHGPVAKKGKTSVSKHMWKADILGVPFQVEIQFEDAVEPPTVNADGTVDFGAATASIRPRLLDESTAALDIEIQSHTAEPFVLRSFRVTAQPRAADMHRHFTATTPNRNRCDWSARMLEIDITALACNGVPLIQGYSREGANRFLMGFVDQTRDTRLRHDSMHNQSGDAILRTQFSMARPSGEWASLKRSSLKETIYISTADKTYDAAIRDYVEFVDAENPPKLAHVPDASFDPLWCSWYAMRGKIDQDVILANARAAKQLGIKTILIDAGWLRPTESDDPAFPLGVIRAREEKFPDFDDMLREMQDMGLRVMVWTAPIFWRGPSKGPEYLKRVALDKRGDRERWLCPRNRETAEIAGRLIADVVKRYNLDGVKIDFIDIGASKCFSEKHPHHFDTVGEGMDHVLRGLHDSITAVNPEALIEYRMNYTNLNNRQYANMYRADDTPYDYDQIRREIGLIRYWSAPIPAHADYAYWPPDETIENKARFMATIVFGCVPTFSLDLTAISDEEKALISAWLEFYSEHRDVLVSGRFEPLSLDARYSLSRIVGESEVFYGIFSSHCPGSLDVSDVAGKTLYLINGTNRPELNVRLEGLDGAFQVSVFDRFHKRQRQFEAKVLRGELRIEEEIEVGGVVRIEVMK